MSIYIYNMHVLLKSCQRNKTSELNKYLHCVSSVNAAGYIMAQRVWCGESPLFSQLVKQDTADRGNASLSLCQVPALLFRQKSVHLNTLAQASFCKMRVVREESLPAVSDKWVPWASLPWHHISTERETIHQCAQNYFISINVTSISSVLS